MGTESLGQPPDSGTPALSAADVAAWVEEHGDALYRFALTRVRNRETAEDLVQETFLAALSALDRFRGQSSTRTWLMAILRRKVADHFRRSNPAKAPSGSPSFDDAGHWLRRPRRWKSPEEMMERKEFRAALDACLALLPPLLAEAFVLRERDGIDVETLCRALDVTSGNLRVRLHRARLLLRECVERSWFGSTM
jgi:RNA polymerase sigma-70 factor (ECF subfamily)